MASPPDYLQPGEEAIAEARRHRASFTVEAVATALLWLALCGATAGAVLGFAPSLFLQVALPLLAAWTALAAVLLAVAWIRLVTTRYILTGERVYHSHGRLRWFLVQTTYDKLTDVHVRQGPLGRRFGYGSLRVGTAGTGIHLVGVPDPFGFKRTLEEARTAFLHALVAEHRRSSRRAAAPRLGPTAAAPTGETLWQGRPAPASFVGQLVRVSWLVLGGVTFLALGASVQRDLLLPGGFFLAFAAVSVAGGWIRYRYTRFEVTGRGVVVHSGWLTRRRVETTYEKVTDVTTTQGLLGRLLDFGEIRINTAGSNEAPVAFAGLAEPERVKALIDEARQRVRRP